MEEVRILGVLDSILASFVARIPLRMTAQTFLLIDQPNDGLRHSLSRYQWPLSPGLNSVCSPGISSYFLDQGYFCNARPDRSDD